jgi:predicted ATPase
MIQKISFQNYKAFEKGEIKLKPITILLGANSVGKSSIINLLLMLQQTANSKNYKSALRLHGENVSMGECENIFRNKDTSKNIVIEFEFQSDALTYLLTKELFDNFIKQVVEPIQLISLFSKEEFIDKWGKINSKVYDSKEDFLKLIETLNGKIDKNREQSGTISYYLKRSEEIGLNDKEKLEFIYDFLVKLKKIQNDSFILSFELCNVKYKKEDIIKIKRVSLTNNNKQVFEVKFTLNQDNSAYKDIVLTSNFTNRTEVLDSKAKEEVLKLVNKNYDSTIFSWLPPYNKSIDFFSSGNSDEKYSMITQIIFQIADQSISDIKSQFTRELINHVSPLRATPKRYYFLDRANINTVLDTFDGNSLAETLKENETVNKKVNKWLKTFRLTVTVDTLQDIIHKLKIHQHSLELDIIDVGFGISQILPVIVQGFLSFDNSLTMIEQPEIHLHPKMQAELADLFIDIVNGSTTKGVFKKATDLSPKKYLLIETHSEYLLKRLMRRISDGRISAQDVAIYFVEPPQNTADSARIQEKEISADGSFEWPQDFYEGEIKKDNANYIKQLFFRKK